MIYPALNGWTGYVMFYAVIAVIGAVCLSGTVHGVYRNVRLRQFGERTTAQVVAVRQHTSTSTNSDGITTTRHTYKAVLSFTTVNGESIMTEESNGGRRPHAEYGQEVPVRYDRRKPSTVEIDTFAGRWNIQTIVGGLACCAILVYILLR